MKKFAISDIHGCAKTFEALLHKIEFNQHDELYLLGDYVDRGPDSKAVIDHILHLQQTGYTVKCLRGNHEENLLRSLTNAEQEALWLDKNGGRHTLQSFGISAIKRLPAHYLDFFRQLEYYFLVDNYILVHGGLNFDIPDPFQDKESLLWIRDWYKDINYDWLKNRIIIHGHTPMPQEHILLLRENINIISVLDIDNGCVFQREGLHQLCAFELNSQTLIFQENIDY